MFDKEELKINVNMTGKEYIEYRNSRKTLFNKPMSNATKKALPYFILSGSFVVVLIFLLTYIFYTPPNMEQTRFEKETQNVLSMSWSDIGKVFAVNYGVLIVGAVALAWVLHGVGFAIIKG